MDLLIVTIECINFLAWPTLAVGYPAFVTIRAIESGCVYDNWKVATYWIIFSFIYLLEHAFAKFFEWVPLWSFLRLIFICWLAIPQLNGAFYLYQNLVHPYLQFKLHYAITQFCVTCSEWYKKLKKDSSIKEETFLAMAKSCLDENASGTFEKLIASKVGSTDENLLQTENKTTTATQVISKPVILAVAKLPDTTTALPVFQTRWTCEICEVRVSSELTLQSHLRGKRHRAEAKLWCAFCNLRVSGEIDMIAHLKGKRHLAKLQETFANSGVS